MRRREPVMAAVFALLFALSLSVNAAQSALNGELRQRLSAERQRVMTDVVDAMADIEVNLQKILLAAGAERSVSLLGETALLSQHVETGLSRLPLEPAAGAGAMKFAGQMGDYVMALARQVSGGGMLSTDDETQIEALLAACQGLNAHLASVGSRIYSKELPPVQEALLPEGEAGGEVEYPSLIYDGPFSDGHADDAPKGLTGERITRGQAREAAARYAGTTPDRVKDAADSGGRFEAFGFLADTPNGRMSVQVTGVGGHLLWMMPEEAAFEARLTPEACLRSAQVWLADMGFGPMEHCFTQIYDGMVVANFASVTDGVLLYPDQVKVQVSMETGTVVGAECSQYWLHHALRGELTPRLSADEAQQMLSSRLDVLQSRLCVIPTDAGEALCWEYEGTFAGEVFLVYIDADSGEMAEILRVARTQEGETAI